MHFDSVTGWVRGVRHCPSPNFNLRPQGDAVSLLVIHNISLPPGQFGTARSRRSSRIAWTRTNIPISRRSAT